MGANSSTRRVSFESDENDNITVVKGIRLSENVINRMREPVAPPTPLPPKVQSPPLVSPPSPLLIPGSPPRSPFDPVTSLPPPPPKQPITPAPSAPITEVVARRPPPPPVEKPQGEAVAPPPAAEPLATPPATVTEEELRKKITEDLQEGLFQERTKAEQELQAWLEKEKAQAVSFAKAEAQATVQGQVDRILDLERSTSQNALKKAVMRERLSAEDERLRAQLYAKQLEIRDHELKKQEVFYREQVARLEDRSAQLYKVTTENYQKAADEVNSKFKRFEVSPVCVDLQGQILKCYQEHTGKTLLCSNIASAYLQCVNQAKQNKLRTGG